MKKLACTLALLFTTHSFADVAVNILHCQNPKTGYIFNVDHVSSQIPGQNGIYTGELLLRSGNGSAQSLLHIGLERQAVAQSINSPIQDSFVGKGRSESIKLTVYKEDSKFGGYASKLVRNQIGRKSRIGLGCYFTR